MSKKAECQDRSLEGECLIETQFANKDVQCSDVTVCPDPASIEMPVDNNKPGQIDFKDHGVIHFGKYKGDRWDSLPFDYLDWLAYKSSMGIDIRKKAGMVLRQVRET
jgi:hypothetical protein